MCWDLLWWVYDYFLRTQGSNIQAEEKGLLPSSPHRKLITGLIQCSALQVMTLLNSQCSTRWDQVNSKGEKPRSEWAASHGLLRPHPVFMGLATSWPDQILRVEEGNPDKGGMFRQVDLGRVPLLLSWSRLSLLELKIPQPSWTTFLNWFENSYRKVLFFKKYRFLK